VCNFLPALFGLDFWSLKFFSEQDGDMSAQVSQLGSTALTKEAPVIGNSGSLVAWLSE
jgi:hypothetical protein